MAIDNVTLHEKRIPGFGYVVRGKSTLTSVTGGNLDYLPIQANGVGVAISNDSSANGTIEWNASSKYFELVGFVSGTVVNWTVWGDEE